MDVLAMAEDEEHQEHLDQVLDVSVKEDVVALNETLTEVEVGSFPCILPDCGEECTSEFWLLDHLRSHRPYPKCTRCNRTFWHAQSLVSHMDLHRRQDNWARRRNITITLYGQRCGYHHMVNQTVPSMMIPRQTEQENREYLIASVLGNLDVVKTHIMPFV